MIDNITVTETDKQTDEDDTHYITLLLYFTSLFKFYMVYAQ